MRRFLSFGLVIVFLTGGAAAELPAPSGAREIAATPGTSFADCAGCPEMVVVPQGSFRMGSDDAREHERPVHDVRISEPLAVSRYPVTVAEFRAYVEDAVPTPLLPDNCWAYDADGKRTHQHGVSWQNPGFAQRDNHPVVCVSWTDTQHYIRWLSAKSGRQYRFLSESEWEYVARADAPEQELIELGTAGRANHGAALDDDDCCSGAVQGNDRWLFTAPVSAFEPNAFGVSGMAGNVSEMVADCVNGDYVGAPADGSAWIRADRRDSDWARNGSTPDGMCIDHMVRGLGWDSPPTSIWHVRRGWWYAQMAAQFIGFRVATTID